MRITALGLEPVHVIQVLNAGRKGIERGELPVLCGRVNALPLGLDALVLTSDLQFVERLVGGKQGRLMGEALPDILGDLASQGVLPSPASAGAVLAGDLFAFPDLEERGGIGDVRPVWSAFASRFRWVAGVLGNHDAMGDGSPSATPMGCHLLDGVACEVDGLRIGGVCGILQRSQSARPNEKREENFVRHVKSALVAELDLLVLHQGPAVGGQRGSPVIASAIEDAVDVLGLHKEDRLPLIVCGHRHWEQPLVEMDCGVQVVNVDKRVVILVRERGVRTSS